MSHLPTMPVADRVALLRRCCEDESAARYVDLPGGRWREIHVRGSWLWMDDSTDLENFITTHQYPDLATYFSFSEPLSLTLILDRPDLTRDDHIDRVLAGCLTMHFLSGDAQDHIGNAHARLARMLASAVTLEGDFIPACGSLLAWQFEQRCEEPFRSFLALGIVMLQYAARERIDFDAQLAALDQIWHDDLLKHATEIDWESRHLDTPADQAAWVQRLVDDGRHVWILCLACLDDQPCSEPWINLARSVVNDDAPKAMLTIRRRLESLG